MNGLEKAITNIKTNPLDGKRAVVFLMNGYTFLPYAEHKFSLKRLENIPL